MVSSGWFDRVYTAGFAYFVGEYTATRQSDRFGEGTLAGKRAMCMVSFNIYLTLQLFPSEQHILTHDTDWRTIDKHHTS